MFPIYNKELKSKVKIQNNDKRSSTASDTGINLCSNNIEIMPMQSDNIALDLTTYREVTNEVCKQSISSCKSENNEINHRQTHNAESPPVGTSLIQSDKCDVVSHSKTAIQVFSKVPNIQTNTNIDHTTSEEINFGNGNNENKISLKTDNECIYSNKINSNEIDSKINKDICPLKTGGKEIKISKNYKDEFNQIESDSDDFDSETSSIKSYEKIFSDDNNSTIESDGEDASSNNQSDSDVHSSKRSKLKMCLRSTARSRDGNLTYAIKNYNKYVGQLYENFINTSDDDDEEKQFPLDFCDMTMEVKDDEIYSPNEIKNTEGGKDTLENDQDYSPSHLPKKKKKKVELKDYKCFRCSKSFDTLFHLKRHRKTHASKRFPCSICKFRATTKERLLDHEDSHFQTKTFQCSRCNYGTNVKRHFRAHERNIHKIKNLKCNECDYETHRNDSLKLHLLSHAETRKFKCSACEYTTNRKDYLKIHEMNHSDVKQFKCPKCDYATNCKRNLKLHDSVHQDAKIFKCSICDYETNRRQSLKLHELNHLDVKKFKCDKCSYATNGKLNLRQHSLTHLETKKFKCLECDYGTNFKSNFKNHEKTHLNVKLLKCPDCNYETNLKQSLKTHMFYHSEKKRFKCSLCDFCTNYKTSLNHHELTHVNSFVENY